MGKSAKIRAYLNLDLDLRGFNLHLGGLVFLLLLFLLRGRFNLVLNLK